MEKNIDVLKQLIIKYVGNYGSISLESTGHSLRSSFLSTGFKFQRRRDC